MYAISIEVMSNEFKNPISANKLWMYAVTNIDTLRISKLNAIKYKSVSLLTPAVYNQWYNPEVDSSMLTSV